MLRTVNLNRVIVVVVTLFFLSCEAKQLIIDPIGSDDFSRKLFLVQKFGS